MNGWKAQSCLSGGAQSCWLQKEHKTMSCERPKMQKQKIQVYHSWRHGFWVMVGFDTPLFNAWVWQHWDKVSDINQLIFFFLRLFYYEKRLEGEERETMPKRAAFATSPLLLLSSSSSSQVTCSLTIYLMDCKKYLYVHHPYHHFSNSNNGKVFEIKFHCFSSFCFYIP